MPLRLSITSDYDTAKESAKAVVSSGGLVVYPTDTLYGIGCNATSEKAVEKIYSVKKREGKKPLSIIVANFEMLRKYCDVPHAHGKILHELLPGPYTFVLQLKKPLPVSETLSVGVRVPEHHFMRQVAKELGVPIVSTSANLSGEKGAAELTGVNPEIAGTADLVLDGGKCKYAQGSTVIDLVQMKVLRKGAVREGDRIEFG
jgi:tRNA threonylcarbamoyl adenosine modification protein (Sua5/YciO/YrdC/YwlC family)